MILGINQSVAGMLVGLTLVGLAVWVPFQPQFNALCFILGMGLAGVCLLHWLAHVLDRLIKRLQEGHR